MSSTTLSQPSCITCNKTTSLVRCACAPHLIPTIYYCSQSPHCQKQGYNTHKQLCKSTRLYTRVARLSLPRDEVELREAEEAVTMDADAVAREYLAVVPVAMRTTSMRASSKLRQGVKEGAARLRAQYSLESYLAWQVDNCADLEKKYAGGQMCDVPFEERAMMTVEGLVGIKLYVGDYAELSMGMFEVMFARGRFCVLDPWEAGKLERVWARLEGVDRDGEMEKLRKWMGEMDVGGVKETVGVEVKKGNGEALGAKKIGQDEDEVEKDEGRRLHTKIEGGIEESKELGSRLQAENEDTVSTKKNGDIRKNDTVEGHAGEGRKDSSASSFDDDEKAFL